MKTLHKQTLQHKHYCLSIQSAVIRFMGRGIEM